MHARCIYDCSRFPACGHMPWNARCLMCDERWWTTDPSDLYICPNCILLGPPDGRGGRAHIGKRDRETV